MPPRITIKWRGPGRWLSLAVAGFLIALAMIGLWVGLSRPSSTAMEAAVGWNLFLGLILLGAIISGAKRAPVLAMIMAILMSIRGILGAVAGASLFGILLDVTVTVLIGLAAFDLWRQSRVKV